MGLDKRETVIAQSCLIPAYARSDSRGSAVVAEETDADTAELNQVFRCGIACLAIIQTHKVQTPRLRFCSWAMIEQHDWNASIAQSSQNGTVSFVRVAFEFEGRKKRRRRLCERCTDRHRSRACSSLADRSRWK